MELELKHDFDVAVRRLDAWWRGEVVDRACFQITCRKVDRNIPFQEKAFGSLDEKWMDVEYQVQSTSVCLGNYEYLGEAFPFFMPNLGPDLVATLFGAELEFGETTSWCHPTVEDIQSIFDTMPDFTSRYWQTICAMTDLALEVGKDRFVTALTDIHANGDLLAALRGAENLCVDCIAEPQAVKEVCMWLGRFYPDIYDRLYSRIRSVEQGTTTWTGIYSSQRSYGTNCDFCCMISPQMFRELMLPTIQEEIKFLDRSIFHLDGPGALCHLDAILDIKELDAVQWVYGAGNGPCTRWVDVYKKILDAGKSVQVLLDDPKGLETILNALPAEGLLISCYGADVSLSEAEDMLRLVKRKSHADREVSSPPYSKKLKQLPKIRTSVQQGEAGVGGRF